MTEKAPQKKKQSRKRKYGDISTEEIVAAVLDIAKRSGNKALSMRAIADELELSPMAAYYYVPNKRALIDLVMDKVYSTVTSIGVPGTPEERLRSLFWQSRELMTKYPGLAQLILSAPGHQGKELTRIRGELKDLFKAAGYSDRYTTAAFLLVALLEYGAVVLEAGIAAGVATNQGYQNMKQSLDDCLSLIFAGLKTYGDEEQREQQGANVVALNNAGRG